MKAIIKGVLVSPLFLLVMVCILVTIQLRKSLFLFHNSSNVIVIVVGSNYDNDKNESKTLQEEENGNDIKSQKLISKRKKRKSKTRIDVFIQECEQIYNTLSEYYNNNIRQHHNDDNNYYYYHTIPNVLRLNNTITNLHPKTDISLVTTISDLSTLNLDLFAMQLKRWSGPISVAIRIANMQDFDIVSNLLLKNYRCFYYKQQQLRKKEQTYCTITYFHFLLDFSLQDTTKISSTQQHKQQQQQKLLLLNLAIQNAPTEMILTLPNTSYATPIMAHDTFTKSDSWTTQNDNNDINNDSNATLPTILRYRKLILLIPTFQMTVPSMAQYISSNNEKSTRNNDNHDSTTLPSRRTQLYPLLKQQQQQQQQDVILKPFYNNAASLYHVNWWLSLSDPKQKATTKQQKLLYQTIPYQPDLYADCILAFRPQLPLLLPDATIMTNSNDITSTTVSWISTLHEYGYQFGVWKHYKNFIIHTSTSLPQQDQEEVHNENQTVLLNQTTIETSSTPKNFENNTTKFVFDSNSTGSTDSNTIHHIMSQQPPAGKLNFIQTKQLQWSTIIDKLSFLKASNCSTDRLFQSIPNALSISSLSQRQPQQQQQDYDIALVTHVSVNKISQLLFQMQRWNGTTSVAIYITSQNDIDIFIDFVRQQYDLFLSFSKSVLFHVLLDVTEKDYPHNILRNLAIANLPKQCDYFFACDADFIVSPLSGHDNMIHNVLSYSYIRHELQYSKLLLVLPSFEFYESHLDPNITMSDILKILPNTKQQLLSLVRQNMTQGFHQEKFPIGHGATNFTKWINDGTANNGNDVDDDDYTVIYYNIDYEYSYEPYIIGYAPGIPEYWPNFRGFGFNKLVWILETHLSGYQFGVLKDFFTFHVPHKATSNITFGRKRSNATEAVLLEFLLHLMRDYNMKQMIELEQVFPTNVQLVQQFFDEYQASIQILDGEMGEYIPGGVVEMGLMDKVKAIKAARQQEKKK